MLSQMRNSRGGPDWRVRALAVVLALLVAGPVVVGLLTGAIRALLPGF